MNNLQRIIIFLLLVSWSLSWQVREVPAQAQPVSLQLPKAVTASVNLIASADSFISSSDPTNNYGMSTLMNVGSIGTGMIRRSLVRFDLSAIPPGATIQSATLQVYCSGGSPSPANVNIGVYRLKEYWHEQTVNWNNQPGRTSLNEITAVGLTNKYYTWDVTATVQGWMNGTFSNYGLMLLAGPETTLGYRTFDTRHNPNNRPFLQVSYIGSFTNTDPQVTGMQRLKGNSLIPVNMRFRNGIPEYVHARLAVTGFSDPIQRSLAFLNSYKDLYALDDPYSQFRISRRILDGARSHIFLQQVHQGVPVYAAELGLHFNGDYLTSTGGGYLRDLDLEVEPEISHPKAEQAVTEAIHDLVPTATVLINGHTGLVILDLSLWEEVTPNPRLAWQVNTRSSGHGEWVYFVDALTGAILVNWAKTKTLDFEIFTYHNRWVDCWEITLKDPSTLWFTEEGPEDEDIDQEGWDADTYFRNVYNYYHSNHSRHSFDDDDAQVEIYVHSGVEHSDVGDDNAIWYCGNEIHFSDGWVARDVMGHEFTHGVIQEEYDPPYRGSAGALEESLGDTFGTFVESKYDVNYNWDVGEDVPGGPIRSMENPPAYGNPPYPDHFSDYVNDPDAVHENAGIMDKAAYLIASGGEHTFHDITVSGLGIEVAEHIFYDAMVHHLGSRDGFFRMREAMIEAAEDKHGAGTEEVCTVRNAYAAVGIGEPDDDCDGFENPDDPDVDGDSFENDEDNCPLVPNPDQRNWDDDNLGNACDSDDDGDEVLDTIDNCLNLDNPRQLDANGNGIGDACEDLDGDNVPLSTDNGVPVDNCPDDHNPYQENHDGDAMGDICDPNDDNDALADDDDGSGVAGDNYCTCGNISDCDDNAPFDKNSNQVDDDCDGVGDVDVYGNPIDNCPGIYNPYVDDIYPPVQEDMDEDGLGDACDPDLDGDHRNNDVDNCVDVYNPEQIDFDANGLGARCDPAEAFMVYPLYAAPHLLFVEFPSVGPLVIPIYPCLDDGCPDPSSTFPEDYSSVVALQLPAALEAKIVDECGQFVAGSSIASTIQVLSFEVHPAYHMESTASQVVLQRTGAVGWPEIQVPLYFLEIYPSNQMPPGQSTSLWFRMWNYLNDNWLFLPLVRR